MRVRPSPCLAAPEVGRQRTPPRAGSGSLQFLASRTITTPHMEHARRSGAAYRSDPGVMFSQFHSTLIWPNLFSCS